MRMTAASYIGSRIPLYVTYLIFLIRKFRLENRSLLFVLKVGKFKCTNTKRTYHRVLCLTFPHF